MNSEGHNIWNKSNKEFLDLFPVISGDERIPWTETLGSYGFSILRDFNSSTRFVPARKKDGSPDDVALIKIGFYDSAIKNKEAPLLVTISKASRFNLSGKTRSEFNKNDPDYPTEESLKKSKESPQLIDLTEEGRFIFNLEDYTIYDTHRKKSIQPEDLIDYVYKLFLSTSNFKGLVLLKSIIFIKKVIDWVLEKLLLCAWDLLVFMGKKIEKTVELGSINIPAERKDYFVWFRQTTYQYNDLTDSGPVVSLLGSEYKISRGVMIFLAFAIFGLFVLNYFFTISQSKFFGFFAKNLDNAIFLLSFTIVLYFFIDSVIPRIILWTVNKLIKFKTSLLFRKHTFY